MHLRCYKDLVASILALVLFRTDQQATEKRDLETIVAFLKRSGVIHVRQVLS